MHLESSTGVLNDLSGAGASSPAALRRAACASIASAAWARCRSTCADVYLATGTTGKSLGSYAGAAIVFAQADLLTEVDASRVPSYLDLPATLRSDGPRSTFPSPTLLALAAALEEYASPEQSQARYQHYAALGAHVRRAASPGRAGAAGRGCLGMSRGHHVHAAGQARRGIRPAHAGRWGFAIGGESSYLAERRLVQIATMGAVTREVVRTVVRPSESKPDGHAMLKPTAEPRSRPWWSEPGPIRNEAAAPPDGRFRILPNALCRTLLPGWLCAESACLGRREDSNLHTLYGYQVLNLARLPIPPLRQGD